MQSYEATRFHTLLLQTRLWIVFMMIAVLLSGITAFPLQTELDWLSHQHLPAPLAGWVNQVDIAVRATNEQFPQLAYGTDWLAFAHIVIALAFIGPFKDPIKNIWVIEWAMICCIAVFPLALIAGPVRHIPFFHRVIDCCFGLLGLIPLIVVRKKIKAMRRLVTVP